MNQAYLNRHDCFAHAAGVSLVELSQGHARATMLVEQHHLNAADVCQGGAIFTLADLAMAAVVNAEECAVSEPISMGLSVGTDIQYLHAAHLGDLLTAEASMLRDGKMPMVEARVYNKEQVLVAVLTARFSRR